MMSKNSYKDGGLSQDPLFNEDAFPGIDRSLFPMAFTSDSQERQVKKVLQSEQSRQKNQSNALHIPGTAPRSGRGGRTARGNAAAKGGGGNFGGHRGGSNAGGRPGGFGSRGGGRGGNQNSSSVPSLMSLGNNTNKSSVPSLMSMGSSSSIPSLMNIGSDDDNKDAGTSVEIVEDNEFAPKPGEIDIRSMLPMSFASNTKKEAEFSKLGGGKSSQAFGKGDSSGGQAFGKGGRGGRGGGNQAFGKGRGGENQAFGKGRGGDNQAFGRGRGGGQSFGRGGGRGGGQSFVKTGGGKAFGNDDKEVEDAATEASHKGLGDSFKLGGKLASAAAYATGIEKTKTSASAAAATKDGATNEFKCEVCNITVTSQQTLDTHNAGKKHIKNVQLVGEGGGPVKNVRSSGSGGKKECRIQEALDQVEHPLIGLDYITEHQMEDPYIEPRYICSLCESKMDPRNLINHIIGFKHRYQYMKVVYPERAMDLWTDSNRKRSECVQIAERYAKEIEQSDGRQPMAVKVELEAFYNPNFDTEVKSLKLKLEKQIANAKKAEMDAKKRSLKRIREEAIVAPPVKKMVVPPVGIASLKGLCDSLVKMGNQIIKTESDASTALKVSNMLTQALLAYRLEGGKGAGTIGSSPGVAATPRPPSVQQQTPSVQQQTMYSNKPVSYAANNFLGPYSSFNASGTSGYSAYGSYQQQWTQ